MDDIDRLPVKPGEKFMVCTDETAMSIGDTFYHQNKDSKLSGNISDTNLSTARVQKDGRVPRDLL